MNAQKAIELVTGAVAQATTIKDSVRSLIDGIAERVAGAVKNAQGNGATAEELQPVVDLVEVLAASKESLLDAVQANLAVATTVGTETGDLPPPPTVRPTVEAEVIPSSAMAAPESTEDIPPTEAAAPETGSDAP